MTAPVAVPMARSVSMPLPPEALCDLLCTLAVNAVDDTTAIAILLDDLATAVRDLHRQPCELDVSWETAVAARDTALLTLIAELPAAVLDLAADRAHNLGLALVREAYAAGHTIPPPPVACLRAGDRSEQAGRDNGRRRTGRALMSVDLLSALRAEFVRLLTEDGPTQDRRRREYNQAIFAPESEGGRAVWSSTDLDMVMEKFDKATARCEVRP